MLTNGISVLGWCLVAVGWSVMIFAPGDMRTSIVNIHQLAIADAAIVSGFFFVIAGALNEGFTQLVKARAPDSPDRAEASTSLAPARVKPASEGEHDDKYVTVAGQPPNFNMLKKTHQIRVGVFDIREVHEMQGGKFVAQGSDGWRNFDTLSEAEQYVRN